MSNNGNVCIDSALLNSNAWPNIDILLKIVTSLLDGHMIWVLEVRERFTVRHTRMYIQGPLAPESSIDSHVAARCGLSKLHLCLVEPGPN